MIEPPPPWARPDPADVSAEQSDALIRVDPALEPDAGSEPDPPPLFPSGALLFPGGPARPRTRDEVPDVPRSVRHVRTGESAPVDRAAATQVPPGRTGPPPGRRPPPMPQQAHPARDTGPGAPAPDPRVGVVAGSFEHGRQRRSYPGMMILMVSSILMITTLVGRSLVGDVQIALTAVPVVLIAGILLAQRLINGGEELTVPVRRFRVQPADGRARRFVIDGEIDPGVLEAGDVVRVHGDEDRDGHVVATSVDILAALTGPVVRQVIGREPRAVVAARVLSWISIVLAVLQVTVAAVVVAERW